MTTQTELTPAIIEALAIGQLPDIQWKQNDENCDCIYQRVGMYTNPYLAETLEIRMCCIWQEIYQLFPQFVRMVPAFWNYNTDEWVTEPMEWNGEDDMPVAIWHRQLARQRGITVAEARALNLPAPKGKVRQPKPTFYLKWSGEYVPFELGQ